MFFSEQRKCLAIQPITRWTCTGHTGRFLRISRRRLCWVSTRWITPFCNVGETCKFILQRVPMTELRYNVTVTQVAENNKNPSLISNGWYVLKPDPHICFQWKVLSTQFLHMSENYSSVYIQTHTQRHTKASKSRKIYEELLHEIKSHSVFLRWFLDKI